MLRAPQAITIGLSKTCGSQQGAAHTKCMTKYVALDVHQATTVASVRGEKRLANKADQPDAGELSELLRRGALRAVYHGSSHRATLQELTRSYQNLVEDSTSRSISKHVFTCGCDQLAAFRFPDIVCMKNNASMCSVQFANISLCCIGLDASFPRSHSPPAGIVRKSKNA